MSNWYRKARPGLYTGSLARFIRGDVDAWAIAPYLIFGPHSSFLGISRVTPAYIAEDLGMPSGRASEALAKLFKIGFVQVDEELRIVWVVEQARHEWGEAPNPQDKQVVKLGKELPDLLADVRKSFILQEFIKRYSPGWSFLFDQLPEGFASPPAALPKPFRSPSEGDRTQVQVQTQLQTQDSSSSQVSGGSSAGGAKNPGGDEPDPDLAILLEANRIVFADEEHSLDPARWWLANHRKAGADDEAFLSDLRVLMESEHARKARDIGAWVGTCLRNAIKKKLAGKLAEAKSGPMGSVGGGGGSTRKRFKIGQETEATLAIRRQRGKNGNT